MRTVSRGLYRGIHLQKTRENSWATATHLRRFRADVTARFGSARLVGFRPLVAAFGLTARGGGGSVKLAPTKSKRSTCTPRKIISPPWSLAILLVVPLYPVPPSLFAPRARARLADGYFFILRVINSHTYLRCALYEANREVPPLPTVSDTFALLVSLRG